MNHRPIHIISISGSLRKNSSNTTLLSAIIAMFPAYVTVSAYDGMAQLPHFNPDLDVDEVLYPVSQWRDQLKKADGIIICTPEYAKGVPGSLKNALDWVVSSGEFVNKPVAAISASPHPSGGEVAQASLLGTLSMMNAMVVEGGSFTVPFVNLKLGPNGELIDEETRLKAQQLIDSLLRIIEMIGV